MEECPTWSGEAEIEVAVETPTLFMSVFFFFFDDLSLSELLLLLFFYSKYMDLPLLSLWGLLFLLIGMGLDLCLIFIC